MCIRDRYTVEVTKAVMSNEDPPFAPATGGVIAEGSLWGVVPGASGSSASSALEIVNGWVYHDGWEGSVQATWNADCTSAYAAGCEGHRRDVLTTPPTPGAKLYIDVTTPGMTVDGALSQLQHSSPGRPGRWPKSSDLLPSGLVRAGTRLSLIHI